MAPVHEFDNPYHARLFCDFLVQKSIKANVFKGSHGFVVAIDEVEKKALAEDLLIEFLANPEHGRYQDASWNSGQVYQGQLLNQLNLKQLFTPLLIQRQMFTSVIAIGCIAIFTAMFGFQLQSIYFQLQFAPADVLLDSNQWWKLFSPALMHFSLAHLVFNLLFWWMLGNQIERQLGIGWLVLLFLVTSVLSNYGQYMVSGPQFGGLSGVVYGVVGFCWLMGVLKPQHGIQLPKAWLMMMVIGLMLGYLDLLWVNVANTAHTVGLLSGCFLVLFVPKRTEDD